MTNNFTKLVAALVAGLLGVAHADVIVYEGFQYGAVGNSLRGQPDDPSPTDIDAIGLDGTWTDTTSSNDINTMFLKSGSLNFGDLATSGNHVGFRSNSDNDIFVRNLTPGAQTSVGSAGELWFSVLFEKLQNSFSAGEGGFALTNDPLGNARIFENDSQAGLLGFGFGPTTAGNDLTAYAWNGNGMEVFDSGGAISVPEASPGNSNHTSASNLGDVRLLVGHVSFDTGAGGTDEYSLFDYQLDGSSSVAGGSAGLSTQIGSTFEVDVDQTALDFINLTRQVNLNYDELRLATTLEEVLGLPAPPNMAAIPEPSTVVVMALALGGLFVGYRRRRNA